MISIHLTTTFVSIINCAMLCEIKISIPHSLKCSVQIVLVVPKSYNLIERTPIAVRFSRQKFRSNFSDTDSIRI